MASYTEIRQAINDYISILADKDRERAKQSGHPDLAHSYGVEFGRKYARIVQKSFTNFASGDTQSSVHAFVDLLTGDVIKAKSWKSPQTEGTGLAVRYNLIDPESRALCFAKAEFSGGYLYKH
jgi:hypothetical protein